MIGGIFRKLLATKFQPTDARKAFPCFDEPQLKAVFKIRIIHPENTVALANFPSVCEKKEFLEKIFFVLSFRSKKQLKMVDVEQFLLIHFE